MDAALDEAFPVSLRPVFVDERFQACFPSPEFGPIGRWDFVVNGEARTAPYRIYNQPPRDRSLRRLDATGQLMARCLLSRHNDGYVRQAALEPLLVAPEPWIVPFVLRLTGEYVLEITELICSALSRNVAATYGEFIAANPSFVVAMTAKATSYWNCYHRFQYPQRMDYPGLRALRLASGD